MQVLLNHDNFKSWFCVPIVTIQQILRHKNLTTTERYIRGLESVRPSLEILSKRNSRPTFAATGETPKKKESEAA